MDVSQGQTELKRVILSSPQKEICHERKENKKALNNRIYNNKIKKEMEKNNEQRKKRHRQLTMNCEEKQLMQRKRREIKNVMR